MLLSEFRLNLPELLSNSVDGGTTTTTGSCITSTGVDDLGLRRLALDEREVSFFSGVTEKYQYLF